MKNKFKKGDKVRVPMLDNVTGKIIEIYTFVDPSLKNVVKFDAPYLHTVGYGDDELELIEKE